jgi:hypothetical protein
VIAQLPTYSSEDQLNSTQHFFRELGRFGLTSAIDAGAGGTPYPRDYHALETLTPLPRPTAQIIRTRSSARPLKTIAIAGKTSIGAAPSMTQDPPARQNRHVASTALG